MCFPGWYARAISVALSGPSVITCYNLLSVIMRRLHYSVFLKSFTVLKMSKWLYSIFHVIIEILFTGQSSWINCQQHRGSNSVKKCRRKTVSMSKLFCKEKKMLFLYMIRILDKLLLFISLFVPIFPYWMTCQGSGNAYFNFQTFEK